MLFAPIAKNGAPAVVGDGEVHVWYGSLDVGAVALPRLSALLSEAEQARARRYVFEVDRHRFMVGRAALRVLLGRYLGVASQEIRFSYGPHGKPRLSEGSAGRLHFNASHSKEHALFAFCAEEAVGVDIELVREIRESEQIVRRFFCPEEVADWTSLPHRLRCRGFFDCWTRKEAYVKALGGGLGVPLDSFQVAFRPGDAPSVRWRDSRRPEQWSMCDVSPVGRCAAALAIRGSSWKLRPWMLFDGWDSLP